MGSEHRFVETGDQVWTLPDGYLAPGPDVHGWAPIPCRSCKALVLFARTRMGKAAPLNPDGTSHFATCPKAGQWRRKP